MREQYYEEYLIKLKRANANFKKLLCMLKGRELGNYFYQGDKSYCSLKKTEKGLKEYIEDYTDGLIEDLKTQAIRTIKCPKCSKENLISKKQLHHLEKGKGVNIQCECSSFFEIIFHEYNIKK